MPVTAYCTKADLERKYSAAAVLEWSDHDDDGTGDDNVVADAINQGSDEIDIYARQWYSSAALAGSDLIKRWAIELSGYFLCITRGNPAPEAMQIEFDRIMAKLQAILDGQLRLPGVPMSGDLSPTMSNLRVDRRYVQSKIRVQQTTSSPAPSVRGQNFDTNLGGVYP